MLLLQQILSFNPIALRKAKIVYNFGLPECSRVKGKNLLQKSKLSLRRVNPFLEGLHCPGKETSSKKGGGRVVRWSWINFQVRGVLLVWIRVGQGPTALAVGAGGSCLDIFALIYPFPFLSPSLWETTRHRLKYCLKRSLSPKTTNQI